MEPNEEKKTKKKKKHPVLIVIATVVLLLVLIAVFGKSGKNSDTAASVSDTSAAAAGSVPEAADSAAGAAVETAAPEETIPDGDENAEYHVGDALMDGDVKIVYVASGDYNEENDFMQPQDGYKYIYLKFAFENTSEKNDASISMYSFECYADGYSAEQYFGGDENLSATLSAGRSTTGSVYYEVPENAQTVEIEYTTNYFTDKKLTFIYDGNQDSGYAPEASTEASAEAYAPGSVVEAGDLTITYEYCENYTSDNQFVTPRDGYHYISCMFEFSNNGDSDQTVSYYDFDCYADGADCDALYSRDDALSATISSGHKAEGSISYEVPDDASVIEVEYLTNVFTDRRIVFSVNTEPVTASAASFEDVTPDSYCYDAVSWATSNGIASGTTDTTFSPDETCTRAEIVTFLWHLAGDPQPENTAGSFTDVADSGSDLYTAVLWAVENGITSGTSDTTFSPDDSVTRGQVVTFLWRYAGQPAADAVKSFEDVTADNPFYNAIMWAVTSEIASGTSETSFSPDELCTRGQVVTFLYRYAG